MSSGKSDGVSSGKSDGVSSGKSDGVRSLFITGLKDECFTCISNCEGSEGVR